MKAAEIAAALADRVEDLARELLPGGRREGNLWRCGSTAGEAGQSMALHLSGARRGRWHDFAADEGGDMLDLVRAAHGLDAAGAMRWATAWLGDPLDAILQRAERRQERAPEAAPSAPCRWSEKADSIWRRTLPLAGSIAETYLRHRGCALPEGDDVRYLSPSERHPWPTMVARVTEAATGDGLSLHFTYLARDGRGKAPIDKPRLLLAGHVKARGVVRLWPDDAVTLGLAIGEGIESALTAAHGFTPIWAAIDAGNLGDLPVLGGIGALTVICDHDRAGILAAEKVAARWSAAGREVRVWRSPIEGQDANDTFGAVA